MANFGGGAGPGNSMFFQGDLSRKPVDQQDLNNLIRTFKEKGTPLPPNLNIPQGTNPRPIAVGTPSMMQIGNVEGMKMAHGIHSPTMTIDGVPRFLESGSHNPMQHRGPVDPSGKEIKELRPTDEEIPLRESNSIPAMPRMLSGTVFPVGNYLNKTVS